MIAFFDVSKAFVTNSGTRIILDQASFVLPSGMNIGILGENGAGKSTLMKMMAGIQKPDRGEIIRHGRFSWPMGFAGVFIPNLSGDENVRIIAELYGEDPDAVSVYCEAFAEIGNYFHQPLKTYSSGMRARLNFAVSLALKFDTYLVDELLAVGTPDFRAKCRTAFRWLGPSTSVIVISHIRTTLEQMCEKFAVLKNGKLIFADDLDHAEAMMARAKQGSNEAEV